MSFRAELCVAGKTYNVYSCNSRFRQPMGNNGRPSSGVHGGFITFTLEGTDDDALWDWIGDPVRKQDGTITFYRIDQDSKFKEIEFKGAYAISLSESFCDASQVAELIETYEGTYSFDATSDNDYTDRFYNASKQLISFHKRTRISYCMYFKISAERIKVDGVEHVNH